MFHVTTCVDSNVTQILAGGMHKIRQAFTNFMFASASSSFLQLQLRCLSPHFGQAVQGAWWKYRSWDKHQRQVRKVPLFWTLSSRFFVPALAVNTLLHLRSRRTNKIVTIFRPLWESWPQCLTTKVTHNRKCCERLVALHIIIRIVTTDRAAGAVHLRNGSRTIWIKLHNASIVTQEAHVIV